VSGPGRCKAAAGCLILSHSTAELLSEEQARVIAGDYGGSNARIFLRGTN
jgi:hypothetical protein